MQSRKTLYASPLKANFDRAAAIQVKDEQDAVKHCLAAAAIAFTTYEVESVILRGKEMQGAPENRSPRRYVGIGRVYSRDDVIASHLRDYEAARGSRWHDAFSRQAILDVVEEFKKHPADAAYITGLERPGDFIRLKAGEKVFDKNGAQVFPPQTHVPQAPAPETRALPKPKRDFHLK